MVKRILLIMLLLMLVSFCDVIERDINVMRGYPGDCSSYKKKSILMGDYVDVEYRRCESYKKKGYLDWWEKI